MLARLRAAARRAEFWVLLSASLFLILFAALEAWIHLYPNRFEKQEMLRVVSLLLICVLFYLGALLCPERTRTMKCLMWLFFGLYLYLLLNFTLLDKGMGRASLIPESVENVREYYINRFVNLKPFRSVYRVYIQGFLQGHVNRYYTLLNLFGNMCAFAPLAFFLPRFWRAARHWYFFLPMLTVSVALIEALQFAFMVGSCDVDDLILNVGGSMILYLLLRIPLIARALDRFATGSLFNQ